MTYFLRGIAQIIIRAAIVCAGLFIVAFLIKLGVPQWVAVAPLLVAGVVLIAHDIRVGIQELRGLGR